MTLNRRHALHACALALAGCKKAATQARSGPRWPELAVRDLAGGIERMPAHTGAPRIVNFWALWCPPCRMELPGLARLSADLAPRGIDVSAIALADDLFPVREYLLQHAAQLRSTLLSPRQPVVQDLGLDSLPQTFFIAGDGAIAGCWVGARDWDAPDVRRELDQLVRNA